MGQFEPRSPTVGLSLGRFLKGANQTALLNLTTTFQDVAGCSLLLPLVGAYFIVGKFTFARNVSAGDDNVALEGRLTLVDRDGNSINEAELVLGRDAGVSVRTHTGVWVIETRLDTILAKLQGRKSSGSGTSRVGDTPTPFGSTIAAFYF